MKKKALIVILSLCIAMTMTACGGNADTTEVEETTVVTESTEALEDTEAECEHEWVEASCKEAKHCSKCGESEGTALAHVWTEATFAVPKTCTVCGETEGERKQSYFEEHGVEVPDAPVSCTVDCVISGLDNPQEYQKVVDSVWEQTDYYTEPAEEEGYQLVHLEVSRTIQLYYDAKQDVPYLNASCGTGVYDWYTGQMLPGRDMNGGDVFEQAVTLEIDGVGYDVSYTKEIRSEQDDWVFDLTGNGQSDIKSIDYYVFKVPDGYDGLVLAAVPKREYKELDTENVQGLEEAEYASLDETDEDYVEGSKYFRINRSK